MRSPLKWVVLERRPRVGEGRGGQVVRIAEAAGPAVGPVDGAARVVVPAADEAGPGAVPAVGQECNDQQLDPAGRGKPARVRHHRHLETGQKLGRQPFVVGRQFLPLGT